MSLVDANLLDSRFLFFGFLSGAQKVISRQDELNKINVFPVADSDTGTNLCTTFLSVINSMKPEKSFNELINRIANQAIDGARGNSGVIFAQFLHGFRCETNGLIKLDLKQFAEALKNSVKRLYDAITDPVEGTILTVIREWSDYVYEKKESKDFFQVFEDSLEVAQVSLRNTAEKIEALRKVRLVDAGAKGFVLFLEGMLDFFKTGKVVRTTTSQHEILPEIVDEIHELPEFRYCTEGVVSGEKHLIDMKEVEGFLKTKGDSLIMAGGETRLHFHVHTNDPESVINYFISGKHKLVSHKIDDMLIQYNWKFEDPSDTILVTDSACDLPSSIRDEYNIYQLPFM